jgi:hypothetical protein
MKSPQIHEITAKESAIIDQQSVLHKQTITANMTPKELDAYNRRSDRLVELSKNSADTKMQTAVSGSKF